MSNGNLECGILKTDIFTRNGENMSRIITYDSQGNDITCMKECDRTDCEEREEYYEGRTN